MSQFTVNDLIQQKKSLEKSIAEQLAGFQTEHDIQINVFIRTDSGEKNCRGVKKIVNLPPEVIIEIIL